MMKLEQRNWLLILCLLAASTAAPLKDHLVRFYPISRAQYDAILSMTSGQPVISEGRLINSGFRTLNNLRTAISSDISSGWHQLLNITGLRPTSNKGTQHKVDGYPLCVIKTNDWDEEQNEEVDTDLEQARDSADEDSEYEARNEENQDYEDDDNRPVVNCIVVVKKPEEHETQTVQAKQKETQNAKNPNQNQRRFARPAYRAPYFYPPYAYPIYPYYDYPYYPEARNYNIVKTLKQTAPKRVQYLNNYARSAATSSIKAESTKPKMAAKSVNEPTKPKMTDKSVGRSGYSGGYYPGSYGGYGGYAGYGGYGNYLQQGYPYSAGYGGCQNTYNPYGQSFYGGNLFGARTDDDDSGEESDVSGEVAGEIGGGEF